MIKRSSIEKIIAALLILALSISIAPKIYLHDVLTAHEDLSSCTESYKAQTHLHKQEFNCHIDQLEVIVPYLFQCTELSFEISIPYPQQSGSYYSSYTQFYFFHQESRGPPQV